MKDSLLVHKHLIVRAEAVKPPMDEKYLTDWLKDFITSIGLQGKHLLPLNKHHSI